MSKTSIKPLEEQIASVLADDNIASDVVATLFYETETAAEEANKAATKLREASLDPTQTIDVAKVAASVASAELTRDRLRAALLRLQARWQEIAEAEALVAWSKDFETVRTERDAMVKVFAETYPRAVTELVNLMHRIAEVDKQVDRVNRSAPSGAHGRLHCVEREARGQLLQPEISIPAELKLPAFDRKGGSLFDWPPPQPNLAVEMARMMPVDNYDWRNWHEVLAAKERQKEVDNDRMKEFYQKQQREREEREAAEVEALKERDRQAYRERGWPSG
jgi:hypothetical protein